jgi:hypothetical protein
MKWIAYRGYTEAIVVKYNMTFKNGKRYRLANNIADDLVQHHAGFCLSKKKED